MSKSVEREVLCVGSPDLDFKTGEAEGLVSGVEQQGHGGSRRKGIPYVMTEEELEAIAKEDRGITQEVKDILRKFRTRDPKLVIPCSY